MSYALVLPDFIPDACLGLNGLRRTHWRTVQRARDEAYWHLMTALGHAEWTLDQPLERARAIILFAYPQHRKRDQDNLNGLAKPLVDALVRQRIFQADDLDHLHLLVVAGVIPGVHETRIQIESVNEEWNP